jgi:hypothetical protein
MLLEELAFLISNLDQAFRKVKDMFGECYSVASPRGIAAKYYFLPPSFAA